MPDSLMIAAFNEWMRRYIEEPERFQQEWKTVGKFIQERGEGQPPSYGQNCAGYLQQLIDEIRLADGEPPTA